MHPQAGNVASAAVARPQVAGGVTRDEFIRSMTQSSTYGTQVQQAPPTSAAFASADANHDGVVTRDEFIRSMTAAAHAPQVQQPLFQQAPFRQAPKTSAAFARADANHDGRVSKDEFLRAARMEAISRSEHEALAAARTFTKEQGLVPREEFIRKMSAAANEKQAGSLPKGHHLLRPRAIFAPGRRVLINLVPIVLNVLLPWAFFTLLCALLTFGPMYFWPERVAAVLFFSGLLTIYGIFKAVRSRVDEQEPTWYPMAAFFLTAAFVTAALLGQYNFKTYTQPYFEVTDLKVVSHLDTSLELGQSLLDAGIAYFGSDVHLDGLRGWHFKHESMYCVAPIAKSGDPETSSYDFWAVGKDCCAMGASDFRCGDWSKAQVRAGIRALDKGDLEYYQLAVKQAETLYGIKSSHPIFFTWSKDPVHEVEGWWKRAFELFMLQSFCFIVFVIIATTLATCCFAHLARARTAYKYADSLAADAYHAQQYGI
eukprot:TRINITY_DN3093_c0_g2_i1.p1 TRINITY_DN3093_c0_g2~~TRINITY_DN3093_c0_g2_i1.p1  ORF type:complete len:484 (-),score=99.19 TRINITY_DN3093_c0_g2_i1:50-1501(-)